MGKGLRQPCILLVTPVGLRDDAVEPVGTWPGVTCGATSAGAELPVRMWCAVRVHGFWLRGAPSNTNLPELEFPCLVCGINKFFTIIKGQRPVRD